MTHEERMTENIMEENKKQNTEEARPEPQKTEIDLLKEQIAKLEKERDEYLNGWKRAKADSINQQKDEMKRMEEIMKFANADIIKDLLLVLDSFAALEKNFRSEARSKELERELDGVLIIKDQLEKILNKQGLEKIKALGEIFDPSLHEAIAIEDVDKAATTKSGEPRTDAGRESGTILEEMVKGWKLNGKVIRPTKVKISK